MEESKVQRLRVFVSHATDDLAIAREIKSELQYLGVEVWMAADQIQGGANFAEEVTNAITSSDAVLVLLSGKSIASPHVKREVNLTVDKNIFFIPVLVDQADGFVKNLPADWNYWLTVVQILKLENAVETAFEIKKLIHQKRALPQMELGPSSNSALKERKTVRTALPLLIPTLWRRLTSKRWKKVVLASVMAILVIAYFTPAEDTGPTIEDFANGSDEEFIMPVDLTAKVIVAKESMMATDYQNELPIFPTAVANYEFTDEVTVDDYAGFRIAYPGDWMPLPEFSDGTMINGCDRTFWILRWRVNNENMILSTATGYIDGSGSGVFEEGAVTGGAGYIQGFACEAPFFKVAKNAYVSDATTKNVSYLTDVNYQLQVWSYKPNI